jgi:lipopolysaccharide transport system permease protein
MALYSRLVQLCSYRHLILSLIHREIQGRYRGSLVGVFWSFITPLLMLVVYTFVFSVVFQSRWNAKSDSKTEFALVLFAGFIVFNFFSECLNRAPSLITSNVNYVKKVVFPLEILPIVIVGAALFHLLVSLVAWILAYIVFIGPPHPTIVFFPFVLMPLIALVLGITWFFASIGVYVRDSPHLISFITTILMFLSPIFYPIDRIPEQYQFALWLNPLTPAIEQFRAILYWGEMPDPLMLAKSALASAIVAALGYAWFQKTRKGFADVL